MRVSYSLIFNHWGIGLLLQAASDVVHKAAAATLGDYRTRRRLSQLANERGQRVEKSLPPLQS
ncbi:hypothetical protein [Pseudomonas sp. EYE_354]|uniref:hypothetical protein n=1 Tax=Pseudomonas sp. EYE_354 TaxID=2853449 RepID=UPI002004452C|nr:hypothetical protein [Pseudomonas sp. EYE_354]MCK6191089.1 hypothetical protein [Pseudomonas sp. EYE_354]